MAYRMMDFLKRLFFGYLEIETLFGGVKIDMLVVWILLILLVVIGWLK
jgi:hypothetical protein